MKNLKLYLNFSPCRRDSIFLQYGLLICFKALTDPGGMPPKRPTKIFYSAKKRDFRTNLPNSSGCAKAKSFQLQGGFAPDPSLGLCP